MSSMSGTRSSERGCIWRTSSRQRSFAEAIVRQADSPVLQRYLSRSRQFSNENTGHPAAAATGSSKVQAGIAA